MKVMGLSSLTLKGLGQLVSFVGCARHAANIAVVKVKGVQMKALRFGFTSLTLGSYMNHLKWEQSSCIPCTAVGEQAGSHPGEARVSQQLQRLPASSMAQPAKCMEICWRDARVRMDFQ